MADRQDQNRDPNAQRQPQQGQGRQDQGRQQQQQQQQQQGAMTQQGAREDQLGGRQQQQAGQGMRQQGGQMGVQQGQSGQQQQFDSSGGGQMGGGRFADQIREHQEVVDASGQHIGTVDHVQGDRIKLARSDSSDGEHHYVMLSQVQGIEGGKVCLRERGDTDFGMEAGGR